MENSAKKIFPICIDKPYRSNLAVSRSVYRLREGLYTLTDACTASGTAIVEAQMLMGLLDKHERILNRAINNSTEVFK